MTVVGPLRRAAAWALLPVVCAGCATPAEGDPSRDGSTAAAGATGSPFATMSGADRRVLADRWVTDREYTQAVGRSARCLREAGFDVIGPRRDQATRLWHVDATIGVRSAGDETADAGIERCAAVKRPVELVFIANRYDRTSADPVGDYRLCLTRAVGTEPTRRQVEVGVGEAMERFQDPATPSGECGARLRQGSVSALPGVMDQLDAALGTSSPAP